MEAETYLQNWPSDGITCLRYGKRSDDLLATSWDGTLSLYDGYTNALKLRYQGKASVLTADFTPDERGAYLGGLEQKVIKYDFESETETVLTHHDEAIRCLEYDHFSKLLYTGSWDKSFKIWDEREGKEQVRELSDKVYAMSVCRNKVVIGMANNKVVIYDTRKSVDLESEEETGLGKYQIRCVRAMPNGAGYAWGSVEGRIAIEYFPDNSDSNTNFSYKCHRVSKVQNGENISYIYPVNDIAFHPKYNTFASWGSDGLVKTWDPIARKKIWKKQFECGLTSLSFNHDGSKLACGISYNYDNDDYQEMIPEPSICILKMADSNIKMKAK